MRPLLTALEARDVPSVVYDNGFQGATAAGSQCSARAASGAAVTPGISTTPVGNRQFLGQFGNTTATLALDNLPAHDAVTISFDLYVINSWDGSDVLRKWGPDGWSFAIDGQTQISTTFSNQPLASPGAANNVQTFGGSGAPAGSYPAFTGAAEVNTLGYKFYRGSYQRLESMDSVYRFTFTVPHVGNSVRFDFRGIGLQGLADESWGLDNVRVTAEPPENVAPAIDTPVTQDLFGTSLTLGYLTNNSITVSDADAGSSPIHVRLSSEQGAITLATLDGLSLVSGANGSGDITVSGTVAAINAALNGMTFTPAADYLGLAEITLTTDDLGNNGAGGPKVAEGLVRIAVGVVFPNDVPVEDVVNISTNVQPPGPPDVKGIMIGEDPVSQLNIDYLKYAKFLTVAPEVQVAKSAVFGGDDVEAIQALEDPIRRQIYDAMFNSAGLYTFPTLKDAQLAFYMRMEAIRIMRLIESPAGTVGKPDFGYFDKDTDPVTAPSDFWKKQPNQTKPFVFDSVAGKSAHDAIQGMLAGKFRGECLGAVHITVLAAADRAYAKYSTTQRFNSLFPNGIKGCGGSVGTPFPALLASIISPQIELKNNAEARKNRNYYKETITPADMIPGDMVYLENKAGYGKRLKPGAPVMYWNGENAIYLGTYKKAGDAVAKPYFMGMGVGEVTEEQLKQKLVDAYNRDMVAANTETPGTAQLSDIKWGNIKRLGGEVRYRE